MIGWTVNFVLLAPELTGPSTFTTNAAPNATRLSIAALLLLVAGVVSITITTVTSDFQTRQRTPSNGLFRHRYRGNRACCRPGAAMMGLLTLSKQYVEASATDAAVIEVLGGVVDTGRYWAHYTIC